MEPKANNADTVLRDSELDEELAGILTAISVVSKRLAKKLLSLQRQGASPEEGGNRSEQNE